MRLSEARRLTLTALVAAVVLGAAPAVGGGEPVVSLAGGSRLESVPVVETADLAVRAPAVPAGRARVRAVKGTPALPPSALAHLDIPVAALLAYHGAAAVMEEVDEPCGLSWTLLAAIGRVESDHGRAAGAQLLPDGTSSEEIRGVALNGVGPVARIRDTDAGLLDGDQVWDRAVGPMQFLPSTWQVVAVDADGDGRRSPDDIDDAALGAAVLLCSGTDDLGTDRGRRTAVFRYNPSDSYVASVLALERAYRESELDPSTALADALMALPAPDAPLTEDVADPGDPGAGQPTAAGPPPGLQHPTDHQDPVPTDPGPAEPPDPTDEPDPDGPADPSDPSDPPVTPDPDPPDPPEPPDPPVTPEPDPEDPEDPGTPDPPDPPVTPDPAPILLTGVLTACGPDLWCLGEQPLDVGDAGFLGGPAGADLDADGVVESRADELSGLAGTEVTALVAADTAPAYVLVINGLAYDGR